MVDNNVMILLHGPIKKGQKILTAELAMAKQRNTVLEK